VPQRWPSRDDDYGSVGKLKAGGNAVNAPEESNRNVITRKSVEGRPDFETVVVPTVPGINTVVPYDVTGKNGMRFDAAKVFKRSVPLDQSRGTLVRFDEQDATPGKSYLTQQLRVAILKKR
jgi:hypothetical protein